MAAAPPTPRDALFRGVFGDREHAFAHLRTLLPDAVARTLEPGSLEPLAETFVDWRLAEQQCDLVVADSIHYSHKKHNPFPKQTKPIKISLQQPNKQHQNPPREAPASPIPSLNPPPPPHDPTHLSDRPFGVGSRPWPRIAHRRVEPAG